MGMLLLKYWTCAYLPYMFGQILARRMTRIFPKTCITLRNSSSKLETSKQVNECNGAPLCFLPSWKEDAKSRQLLRARLVCVGFVGIVDLNARAHPRLRLVEKAHLLVINVVQIRRQIMFRLY